LKLDPVLEQGILLKRYKRFLTDVELPNGEQITIHCPNTGSMKNCLAEGEPCWFSDSANPKRKYRHTWEIATTPDGFLAGVNTGRANHLVREAIGNGVITELQGYDSLRAEVKYGEENSRIDFLLEKQDERCYVEVKSTTLGMGSGLGVFPDSVTTRGAKHLRELAAVAQAGDRAVLLFCVQHSGIERVEPADNIDPAYGKEIRKAIAAGVEVLAYKAKLSAEEIVLVGRVPFKCPC